jgi:hypothetical protein
MSEKDPISAERWFPVEALERWHKGRFGHTLASKEAHGYWIFFVGTCLVFAGFLLFASGYAVEKESTWFWTARQTAAVLGSFGVLAVLHGTVRLLPVRQAHRAVEAVGTLIYTSATFLFILYYPANWNVPSRSPSPDYSGWVSVIYFLGIAFILLPGFVRVWTEGLHVSDRGSARELNRRIEDLEQEVLDLSSTVEGLREENRKIRSTVDELERSLQMVSERYEESLSEGFSEDDGGED